MEILSAIKKSSDRYASPDGDYGYGIPDFNLAGVLLQLEDSETYADNAVTAFPNPFRDDLYIVFRDAMDFPVDIRLYDLAGKMLFTSHYTQFPGREYISLGEGLSFLPKGVYLLHVEAGGQTHVSKLIRF
jgi:hypothetical protein